MPQGHRDNIRNALLSKWANMSDEERNERREALRNRNKVTRLFQQVKDEEMKREAYKNFIFQEYKRLFLDGEMEIR